MASVSRRMQGLQQRFCKESTQHYVSRSVCVLCLLVVMSVVLYPKLWSMWSAGAELRAAAGRHAVLLVSSPTQQVARDVARAIMERQMAASVDILPGTSTLYYWKGEVQDTTQIVMLVKTKTSKIQKVIDYVRSIHPYESPDILSLTVGHASAPYIRWMDAAVPDD